MHISIFRNNKVKGVVAAVLLTSSILVGGKADAKSDDKDLTAIVLAGSRPSSKNECSRKLSVIQRHPALTGAAIVVGVLGLYGMTGAIPTFYHEWHAAKLGLKHIGAGIYHDPAAVLATLNSDELAIIRRVPQDDVAIAAMFSKKLYGDPSNISWETSAFFPRTRTTASYLKGQSTKRGCCRHKAAVLKAILADFGIVAEVEAGILKSSMGHAWVFLPKYNVILDPAIHPEPIDADQYRTENVSVYDRDIVNTGLWKGADWGSVGYNLFQAEKAVTRSNVGPKY